MEDHFDKSWDLGICAAGKRQDGTAEKACSPSQILRHITYTRQAEALGLGHAVLQAKSLVGDEPFAVILPDDIVDAEVPCMKQMVEAFERTGSSILGSEVVEGAAISNYGCLDCTPDPLDPKLLDVRNLVEKPKASEAPSQNAIIGRYNPDSSHF